MNRTHKLLAAVLIMALAVFLFAGCGGDEEETAPPPKAEKKSSNKEVTLEASEMPESLVGQAVVPTKDSPEDFVQAIDDKQPIVVTFYMPAPFDDSEVRSSVMTLEGRYRGQVEFFSYLYSDAQSYKDLVTLLSVDSTPTVVIINRQGTIQRAWTGFVDEPSIEQGIVEALASDSR
ncbi:MAG: hypothetical protein ACYC5A_00020 [Thermoleophilia bacterium]